MIVGMHGVGVAIHPHTGCPHCAMLGTIPVASAPETGEATPIELFEWFMRNHSESKQIIVDRLRRDFRVFPQKKPGGGHSI